MRKQLVQTCLFLLLIWGCEEVMEDNFQEIEIKSEDRILTIDENPHKNQFLDSIPASVNQGELNFSILNESISGAFHLNDSTGVLTVLDSSKFDYETNPKLTTSILLQVKNTKDTVHVTVNLNDLQETSGMNLSVTIDENPEEGLELGFIQGIANQDNTVFSFISQNPENAFGINGNTGRIHVGNAGLFDYEVHPSLSASVLISNGGELDTATVLVTLNDLSEIILQGNDLNLSVAENPTPNQFLSFITANVASDSLTFELLSQSPESAITVNTSTGGVFVNDSSLFDYEVRTTISAEVRIVYLADISSDTVAVNLTIINDKFEASITASNFETSIAENSVNGTVLGTVSANTDRGQIEYALVNSANSAAVSIDAQSGVLSIADESFFDYEKDSVLLLNYTATVENVVETAQIKLTITNIIEVQERLDNGESPFQIYQSDNSLLGELHGKYYHGGLIAHLNLSDGSGLLVAVENQGKTGWGCDTTLTEALGTGIGQGKNNTNIILATACGDTVSAAILANNYSYDGYSDWHLPSNNELQALYLNVYLKGYGNFNLEALWSSTEFSSGAAYLMSLNLGSLSPLSKTTQLHVRAVRYFTETLSGSKR